MNNILRRGLAAGAALAVTAAVGLLGAGVALANPTDQPCRAGQLDTTLVAGSPGAGQRYASLQFTAKPGNSCKLTGPLPVTLNGAPSVTVVPDTGAATPVYLTSGKPAHVLLHWTGIGAPEQQQTPASVTVGFPAERPGSTTLPWKQGPVDAFAEAHTLRVGPVQAGPAEG
ncbi:DUF4232 domain-containing protein [Crossiella sp. CA-258035]|uniref:DUF4232 domain-containing protein n=1 Tax=Crossiella sp. CA-258035 TaxID=2981138 RepID=UPI0024BCE042|nr:DUF4232 domain-containing protein [Crossiella sp. CA-258035]WHT22220.1 DUF4232 domain-containing protein [Crossiella sp. CA-258035]